VPKVQPNAKKRLLRLKEGAVYLSLSTWQLRRVIQSGQVPVVRVGPNAPWLVDIGDLDKWVDTHKETID
jgi:hypothetical protein